MNSISNKCVLLRKVQARLFVKIGFSYYMRGAIVWGMVRTRNWGLISVEQLVRRLDYLWNETDQSTDEIWKYWHRMATAFTSRHSCYIKTHRPKKIRSQLNIYKQSEDCCLVSWLPDKGCWWCPTRFYICGQIWVQLRFGQIIPSCPQWPVITESKALDKWSASKVRDYFQGTGATDISFDPQLNAVGSYLVEQTWEKMGCQ